MGSYGFSEDANADLHEICTYLELRNKKFASQLFDSIRKKCKLVADFPEMGRSYEELIPGLRGLWWKTISFFMWLLAIQPKFYEL
jgi:toxin ParE1/3/4